MSERGFLLRIPLRIKFTFFIGVGALLCMALLAGICIDRSVSYTEQLIHDRLAQFASLKSQQIQRDINNQALGLYTIFQSDNFYTLMDNLYEGNITTSVWATGIANMLNEMFSTQMRSYQLSTLYDNSGNFLFSMPNPEISSDVIRKLEPSLSILLPLGNNVGGRNQTRLSKNMTAVADQAAAAAVDASWAKISPSRIPVAGNESDLLNFVSTPDKVYSWMSQPVPLVNYDRNVSSYSYSLTIPITHRTVTDDIQTSRMLGYTTCVLDCSQYMNGTNILDFDESLMGDTSTHASFSLLEVNRTLGWRPLFPGDAYSALNRQWRPFSQFPAAEAAQYLEDHTINHKGGQKPGGAIMVTQTPEIKKASVGFSYANVINQNWIITIAMAESAVQAGYSKLTKTLVGIAIGDLAFVILCAFFLTGLTTSPLYHIYRGMELQSDTNPTEPKKNHNHILGQHHMPLKSQRTCLQNFVQNFHRFWQQPFHMIWYRQEQAEDLETQAPRIMKDEAADSSSLLNRRSVSMRTIVASVNHVDSSSSTLVTLRRESCDNNRATDGKGSKVNTSVVFRSQSQSSESCSSDTESDSIRANDLKDANKEDMFKVPLPIAPLNRRWIVDEFDELITEYNAMVERLNLYGAKMNDEVKLRTEEAQESQLLAEAANKAKTIFLMNITNELRTPMNGILGIAAIAYYERDITLTKLRGYLQTIISSGEILKELLQQLLNYSSQLADDEFNYKEFDLKTLAQTVLDGHAARAEAKRINFTVKITPETSENLKIGSDLGKIDVICANLVSNALKFTDPEKNIHRAESEMSAKVSVDIRLLVQSDQIREVDLNTDNSMTSPAAAASPTSVCTTTSIGGSVAAIGSTTETVMGTSSLSSSASAAAPSSSSGTGTGTGAIPARAASLTSLTSNDPIGDVRESTAILEIVITDNGVGIDQLRLNHIFDAFVHGDETLSNPFAGPGLGLAMSKMECERLGGDITVYSQVRLGTIVILRLPVTMISAEKSSSLMFLSDFESDVLDETHQELTEETAPRTNRSYLHSPFSSRLLTPILESSDSHDDRSSEQQGLKGRRYSKHVMTLLKAPMINTKAVGMPTTANAATIMNSREASKNSDDLALKTLSMLSNLATLNAINSNVFEDDELGPATAETLHSRIISAPLITDPQTESSISLAPSQIAESLDADYSKLRVLIADDNETIRTIMQKFMNKLGIHEIDLVSDGPSVIEKIERAIVSGMRYSIIFMDLSMPGSDGLEATKAIQRQLGYYCPVVALTGHSDELTAQSCLKAGIQRVLVKPVSFQVLAKTVAELGVQ